MFNSYAPASATPKATSGGSQLIPSGPMRQPTPGMRMPNDRGPAPLGPSTGDPGPHYGITDPGFGSPMPPGLGQPMPTSPMTPGGSGMPIQNAYARYMPQIKMNSQLGWAQALRNRGIKMPGMGG